MLSYVRCNKAIFYESVQKFIKQYIEENTAAFTWNGVRLCVIKTMKRRYTGASDSLVHKVIFQFELQIKDRADQYKFMLKRLVY